MLTSTVTDDGTSECFFSDARILVVDDERSNVLLLEGMLRQWGYWNVVFTTDSSEVAQLCAELAPDLILLDLHMPAPDGFELLGQLSVLIGGGRHDPVVPIIVISADLTDEARYRALSMGANDFIVKPFKPVDTLLRVRNLLKLRRLYREVTAHNRLLEERLGRADALGRQPAHQTPRA